MGEAQRLLRTTRIWAGLTQAELARRSGVTRTVVNAYERGTREPSAAALATLLAAAGAEIRVAPRSRIDPARNDRILQQVLDLAEQLPTRRRGALRFPTLRQPTRP